ncbi:extracellular solute-binding protein [Streptomyces sp. NPDC002896]|uniref:ABC transporter substrate-binding protein n=1 Tax=Streptomyces sp. NPDC002896 TaxID=3154438 RepID=UPI00331F5A43
MRKFLAPLGASALMLVAVACGKPPTASASDADVVFGSVEEMAAAAEKEGTVLVYTDFLPTDAEALKKAFKRAYPKINLQVQRIGGTDLIARYEGEMEAGAPSADVVISGQPDYYAGAVDRGMIVPLRDTGVLGFVPNFPKKYIYDELDTALIQAIQPGLVYNTEHVPGGKVPKTWEDLLDPFWKGKVVTYSSSGTDNTNQLMALNLLVKKYGSGFLDKLAGQLGPDQGGIQPMHSAVGAGEAWVAMRSLPFMVEAMKAEGAPVEFVPMADAYWPTHGFGMSAKAAHPAGARLLSYFLLTPEGSESVNTPVGSYGPYDDIPDTYVPPTPKDMRDVKERSDELLKPFKN